MKTKPTIKDWIFALRPWSFSVSGLPALVAMLFVMHTHDTYNWALAIIAIIGAVIFHAGGNLLSDYHDYTKGVDSIQKEGGNSLLSGLFTPKQILRYGTSLITIGIAIGLFLVYQSGIGLLWIGLIGTIGAVFYFFFKFRALGDLLIFLVYGPTIMLGTGYVMLGEFDWMLILISFPMAFITVNVLHSNNTRDQKLDRYAEIKTFAMLIGTKSSIIYYLILTALSYLSVIAMVIFNILPATALITLLTLPVAYKNCISMKQITDEDMTNIETLDLRTAQLQTMFSLLMMVALIVSNVI